MAAARGTCRHGAISQDDLSSALNSIIKHARRHYLSQHGRDLAVCFVYARGVAGHKENCGCQPSLHRLGSRYHKGYLEQAAYLLTCCSGAQNTLHNRLATGTQLKQNALQKGCGIPCSRCWPHTLCRASARCAALHQPPPGRAADAAPPSTAARMPLRLEQPKCLERTW